MIARKQPEVIHRQMSVSNFKTLVIRFFLQPSKNKKFWPDVVAHTRAWKAEAGKFLWVWGLLVYRANSRTERVVILRNPVSRRKKQIYMKFFLVHEPVKISGWTWPTRYSLLTHGLVNHIAFSGVQVNCFLHLINIQYTYIDFEKVVGRGYWR